MISTVPASHLISIDLPPGWQSLQLPNGTAIVSLGDIDATNGHPRDASFYVRTALVLDSERRPLEVVADEVMRLRVAQGFPDRFEGAVGAAPALGFEYTDGVACLRSYFAQHPSTEIIEFTVSSRVLPSGALVVELEPAANEWLARLHWLQQP